MEMIERNPAFANKLIDSTSVYLRQHAHNPVFWYPWDEEAINRARKENKPILLSVGYSSCYWCHVMEREVFENLSIASLMNRLFINIKVDREEHPAVDELYMVARQLMTNEGGWPNNVFLTPDLQPFYAGGTYGAHESYGKPSFPRLLEWLHYSWTTQEETVRAQALEITKTMTPFLVYQKPSKSTEIDITKQALELRRLFSKHHDERSGGFYQSPKFPHECYLQFLLNYHAYSGDIEALNIAAHSLGKMAAGGINDHVGCGFHRYAVDKDWMVPHFEKMLYNQAMLARCYLDAFHFTGNHYFANIAQSILDFVAGPLTSGNGAFFSSIDAETDQVEGAFYAWTPEQLEALLTPEEANFFVHFFALADIPSFPGHKHPEGQVIIMRKPMDQAAVENNMPYDELSAMVAHVMNKLLAERNMRKAPPVDDKIIVSWNGMMIDAYSHAGKLLANPHYIKLAERAANFMLEYAIGNESSLCRVIAGGKAQFDGTLEDYAYLIKGLISLHRANQSKEFLEAAVMLAGRVEDLFSDPLHPGYFATVAEDNLMLLRIKSHDDSTLPCANAVMIENLIALSELTASAAYKKRAETMIEYFLSGIERIQPESASMIAAAIASLEPLKERPVIAPFEDGNKAQIADEAVKVECDLVPEDILPGEKGELTCRLIIRRGYHINASSVSKPHLIPTQCDLQGDGVIIESIDYPAANKFSAQSDIYEGEAQIRIRFSLSPDLPVRPPMKLMLGYQPCDLHQCYPARNVVLSL